MDTIVVIFHGALWQSNIFRVAVTLLVSAISYFVFVRLRFIFYFISLFVFSMILISALLDIGEVYSYSDYYKRAFWYFGDDVTTCLSLFLLLAITARDRLLGILLSSAAILSGGRIGLLLIIIQAVFLAYVFRRQSISIARLTSFALICGAGVYFSVVASSPYAIKAANSVIAQLNLEHWFEGFEPTRLGYSDCRTADCFKRKVKRPFRMRSLSAVGGLWMTFEGGFPGSRYPNTPEKFADLMVEANPWGVNERYNVSRDEWIQIGTVQSPYVGFGAGYGPALLALAMGFIGAVCLVGLWLLSVRPPDPWTPLTVFFIVNAIFNQTQPWLLPGPVLFIMGLCGTHILWRYFTLGATGQDQPLPGGNPLLKEA